MLLPFGKKVVKRCPEGHEMELAWRSCPRCTGRPATLPAARDMTDLTIVADVEPGESEDHTRMFSSQDAVLEAVRPLAVLVVAEGERAGQRFPVHAGRTKLGKAPREEGGDALLPLGDPYMSRDHAAIVAGPGGVVLVDLGSTNGTWVNGHRVDRAVLAPGDRVVLGRTTLQVTFDVQTHATPHRSA